MLSPHGELQDILGLVARRHVLLVVEQALHLQLRHGRPSVREDERRPANNGLVELFSASLCDQLPISRPNPETFRHRLPPREFVLRCASIRARAVPFRSSARVSFQYQLPTCIASHGSLQADDGGWRVTDCPRPWTKIQKAEGASSPSRPAKSVEGAR